jgi:septum formation protein
MFEKYRNTGKIQVISALTVVKKLDGEIHTVCGTETTELVYNDDISQEFIASYIESEEGLNVAGGFKFQEKGSVLFKHISGDYFNIVGLPVSKTFDLLHLVLGI